LIEKTLGSLESFFALTLRSSAEDPCFFLKSSCAQPDRQYSLSLNQLYLFHVLKSIPVFLPARVLQLSPQALGEFRPGVAQG